MFEPDFTFYVTACFQFRCCGVDSYRDWSDVSELSIYQTAVYPAFARGRNLTSHRDHGIRKVFRVPASCCEYVAPSDVSTHPNVVSWSNCYASVESAEEVQYSFQTLGLFISSWVFWNLSGSLQNTFWLFRLKFKKKPRRFCKAPQKSLVGFRKTEISVSRHLSILALIRAGGGDKNKFGKKTWYAREVSNPPNQMNRLFGSICTDFALIDTQVSRGGRKYFSGCYTKLQKSLERYKLLCEVTNITVSAMVVSVRQML